MMSWLTYVITGVVIGITSYILRPRIERLLFRSSVKLQWEHSDTMSQATLRVINQTSRPIFVRHICLIPLGQDLLEWRVRQHERQPMLLERYGESLTVVVTGFDIASLLEGSPLLFNALDVRVQVVTDTKSSSIPIPTDLALLFCALRAPKATQIGINARLKTEGYTARLCSPDTEHPSYFLDFWSEESATTPYDKEVK